MDANFLVRFDVCQSCKGNVNNGWWAMHFLVLEVPLWRVFEYWIEGDGISEWLLSQKTFRGENPGGRGVGGGA